jgi:hypothetical protein
MIVYVVTNPELGWDCVVGVFTDKDYVYSKYNKKNQYVIHNLGLCENKISPNSEITYLKKFGRTDIQYTIKDCDYEKEYLIQDSFNYTIENGEVVDESNSKEIVSLILDLFSVWAKEKNIKYDNLYLDTPAQTDNDYYGNYACMCDGMSKEDEDIMYNTGCELFDDFLKTKGIISHG